MPVRLHDKVVRAGRDRHGHVEQVADAWQRTLGQPGHHLGWDGAAELGSGMHLDVRVCDMWFTRRNEGMDDFWFVCLFFPQYVK